MFKAISFSNPPPNSILYQPSLFILKVIQNPIQTGLNNNEDLLTHVPGRLKEMEDFSIGLI